MKTWFLLAAARYSVALLLALSFGACSRASYSFQLQPAAVATLPTQPTLASEPARQLAANALAAVVVAPARLPHRPGQGADSRQARRWSRRLAVVLAPRLPQVRQVPSAAPYRNPPPDLPAPVKPRSRGVALLLAVLLLPYGIYNFYLGYSNRGTVNLVLVVVAGYLLFLGSFGAPLNAYLVAGIALGACLLAKQLVDIIGIITGTLQPKDDAYYPRLFQIRPDKPTLPTP